MTNRISSEVKLQLYKALPSQRLMRLANTFGVAGSHSHAELAKAMAAQPDGVILTFINSHLDFLELKELRGITKKLGVGNGAHFTALGDLGIEDVEPYVPGGLGIPIAAAPAKRVACWSFPRSSCVGTPPATC